MHKSRIAIVGAGLSGLILAKELGEQAEVTLFEKSRGVGGRMAHRYAQLSASGADNEGIFDFDHGTQFFTAKTAEFQAWLEPFLTQGLIAEWCGKVIAIDAAEPGNPPQDRPWPEPHYVAQPNMNSLAKELAIHLSGTCRIRFETEVGRLPAQHASGWLLTDKSGRELGDYHWVISTAPPMQTMSLFADHLVAIHPLEQVVMEGCYTLMLGYNKPWNEDWIAAKVRNSPIEWIAINSSKPGRNRSVTSIVIHTSNHWAQQHIDDDLAQTQASVMQELTKLSHWTSIGPTEAEHVHLHRWRYALKTSDGKSSPYIDKALQLASTGDWCQASRIEDVWLSAHELASLMSSHLNAES